MRNNKPYDREPHRGTAKALRIVIEQKHCSRERFKQFKITKIVTVVFLNTFLLIPKCMKGTCKRCTDGKERPCQR